ncbi:MAG: hypothetical protein WA354_21395 [Terracidiphilus sp.]
MNLIQRIGIAIFICAASGACADATPIVIARTTDGFLIGTNSTRSDGAQHCKIHYVGKKLLLVAGQPVDMQIVNDATGKSDLIFDLHKDLWRVFRQVRSDKTLMDIVKTIVVKDIASNSPRSLSNGVASFNLALISTDGAEPALTTMWLEFHARNAWQPTTSINQVKLAVGQAIYWAGVDPPVLLTRVNGSTDILSILQETAKDARRQNAEQQRVDRGFEPPFIILALEPYGLRRVDGDLSVCTSAHPLPFPTPPANH